MKVLVELSFLLLLSLTVKGFKYLITNNLKKSRHTTKVCNLLIIKYIEGGPLRA